MISTRGSDHSIRIVTDTTASLPAGYAAAHGVAVAPQMIIFGEESYLEEREIGIEEFIRRLKTSPIMPRTSAPPPGEFITAYERALAEADTVISLHPSVEVSGTIRSAQTAKESTFPDADIRILDTRTVGGALGTLVQLAVEAAEADQGADEIMAYLQAFIPRTRTYFAVSTLEFLQRGGRIGRAAALAGELLSIKPLLQLTDGQVAPLEKVRTHRRALHRLHELAVQGCGDAAASRLCVMEVDALAEAQQFRDELQQALGVVEIPLVGIGAAITTHVGPGLVGVSFLAGA